MIEPMVMPSEAMDLDNGRKSSHRDHIKFDEFFKEIHREDFAFGMLAPTAFAVFIPI